MPPPAFAVMDETRNLKMPLRPGQSSLPLWRTATKELCIHEYCRLKLLGFIPALAFEEHTS